MRRPREMSSADTRKKRKKAWHLQGGICWLCEKPVPLEEATLDHVFPLSVGGSNAQDNLRAAHAKCNNDRANPPGQSKEERYELALLAWKKGWRTKKPKMPDSLFPLAKPSTSKTEKQKDEQE